jgi:molybdopterin/thiamine biosynthesis adenylyltransferase
MNTVVLFPAELWDAIDEADWGWGYLNLRIDKGEGVVTIAQATKHNGDVIRIDTGWQGRHYLRYADIRTHGGVWYRVHPDLHLLHDQIARRANAGIKLDAFRQLVTHGWVPPHVGDALPVVAVTTPRGGGPAVSAWWVSTEGAIPEATSVVDDRVSPLAVIADEWPAIALQQCSVAIIGVGSIGSAVAETLALAGIGEIALIDHDRLEQRNLARHRLTDTDLGRYKVLAMRDHLTTRVPNINIDPVTINIIAETDVLRPIAANVDLIVCAADGVAARRTANHVARRAQTPLVLAAVLEDGAFGELIRVRQRSGCLYCLRLAQVEAGQMDPEPGIDLGYGTGTAHRPMTAAPPDLQLVADLASKMTLSTLLEARGRWNQRLPGDYAIIGLQPKPDFPTPFDLSCAGDIRWHVLPNRRDDCPTCTTS